MEPEALEREVEACAAAYRAITEAVGEYVVGNRELVDLVTVGVLTGGHVLVDGVPGTAKTTISKIMARLIGFEFSRVQGAVDVQPADIIGVHIFDADRHEFVLHRGPLFANFVMVDEINRLTPKTQSAFIEAMAEHQATVDGTTYPLGDPYFVVATQNTQELEGTFPLIEAQRDRFSYGMTLHHLDREREMELLRRDRDGALDWDAYVRRLSPVLSADRVRELARAVQEVFVDDAVLRYIRDLVLASRSHGDVRLGTSSRGSLALLRGAKARAALDGRTYAIPDDVKGMARAVLGHRLVLEREAEVGGVSVAHVIGDVVSSVEVA